jgi:hypothetical protein
MKVKVVTKKTIKKKLEDNINENIIHQYIFKGVCIRVIQQNHKSIKYICEACMKQFTPGKISSMKTAHITELGKDFCTWKCAVKYIEQKKALYDELASRYGLFPSMFDEKKKQKYITEIKLTDKQLELVNKKIKKKIKKEKNKCDCLIA